LILENLRSREVFADLAALDESVFPLDRAALAIALEEYPHLNIESYLSKLDTLAARKAVDIDCRDRRSARPRTLT